MIDLQLKKRLVEWLTTDYSPDEAEEQISSAKISIMDVVVIEYDNGHKDVVRLSKDSIEYIGHIPK